MAGADARRWEAEQLAAKNAGQWVDPNSKVTVQRALGHSSAATTLSTYAHWFPSAEDRTRNAAQAMIDECDGLPADRDLPDAA